MKRIFLFIFFIKNTLLASVITDNIVGEYFDTALNSSARFIYLQLTVGATDVLLECYNPEIYPYVKAAVQSAGLSHVQTKQVFVRESYSDIMKNGAITLDFEVDFIPNTSASGGYEGNLQLMGQVIATNVFNQPNPVQYFLLEMTPISPGRVQNVYCDLLYSGKATKKWILPSYTNFINAGIFVSQTWETNQIVMTLNNEITSIPFTFQIPYSSFSNLQQGVYQLRILATMKPIQEIVGLKASVIGSFQKLLNQAYATASGQNSVYIPNSSQLVNINQNIGYLTNLIVEVESSN
jgi:hypothetical protein